MFKNIFSKQSPPTWLTNYFDAKEDLPSTKKPFNELRFVVLDTETTGLDIKQDNVISIGAVAIENQSIIIEKTFGVGAVQ